jgi:hypothetical protein
MFMGRESFRMEIVGAGAGDGDLAAIPNAFADTPTARIIERRRPMRVPPPVSAPVFESPAQPRRFTIIGICLMTFACGMAVATALNDLRRHDASPVVAQAERAPAAVPRVMQPAAVPPVMQPAAVPPVMLIQPLPKLESERQPLAASEPAAKAPANDPGPQKRPAPAKVAASIRARPAPRPRDSNSAPSAHQTEASAMETAPAKPVAAKRWVDPFAE